MKGTAPPTVHAFFQELYFTDNPYIDNTLPSVVYEAKRGKVGGFLGAIRRKMSVCGQPIRVRFGGNFVVHPEVRGTVAAMRLLGTLMAGDQDISQTDSANDISRYLLERIGWRTIATFSVHWVRLLRPAQFAAYAASRQTSPAISSVLRFAAKPFCSFADNIAARLSFNPFRQIELDPRVHASDLDVETLLHCLDEFRGGYSLWPEYDLNSLQWLLSFMDRMPARGALRKVIIRDDGHKILGWYIYYAKPGAVGEVVQIGGGRQHLKDVLDHLFYDAWSRGVVALHGVVNSRLMPDFSLKNCVFTCRGGWALAHSRKPELIELLNRGDAFISRLDGEWCLDPGGRVTS
jgi:hypothetical protein